MKMSLVQISKGLEILGIAISSVISTLLAGLTDNPTLRAGYIALIILFLLILIWTLYQQISRKKVLLIFPTTDDNRYLSELALGIAKESRRVGLDPMCVPLSTYNSPVLQNQLDEVKDGLGAVDGVALLPGGFTPEAIKSINKLLREASKPVLYTDSNVNSLLGEPAPARSSFVRYNNELAADSVGNYLKEITQPDDEVIFLYPDSPSKDIDTRRTAVTGLPRSRRKRSIKCGASNRDYIAYEETLKLLQEAEASKGSVILVCATDDLSLACHDAVLAYKLLNTATSTKEVSLIGFDKTSASSRLENQTGSIVRIRLVDQDIGKLAESCAAMMKRSIRHHEDDDHTLVPSFK